MTDAREVARSLSKAQREADILTPDAKYLLLTGEDRSLFGMAGVALILRGLMDYRRRYWLFGAAPEDGKNPRKLRLCRGYLNMWGTMMDKQMKEQADG